MRPLPFAVALAIGIALSGALRADDVIDLPDEPPVQAQPQPKPSISANKTTRMRSLPMVVFGIVLVAGATALVPGGIAVLENNKGDDGARTVGAMLILLGGACALMGFGGIVLGVEQIPDKGEDSAHVLITPLGITGSF